MRGNHIHLGRRDYMEPAPMPLESLERVKLCELAPRQPGKAKPNNWHEVRLDGEFIGLVASRMVGQCFWPAGMNDWMFAASDWNRSDPPFAHAVLGLLDYIAEQEAQ